MFSIFPSGEIEKIHLSRKTDSENLRSDWKKVLNMKDDYSPSRKGGGEGINSEGADI